MSISFVVANPLLQDKIKLEPIATRVHLVDFNSNVSIFLISRIKFWAGKRGGTVADGR